MSLKSLRLPADKSISHRALIFSALTSEQVIIRGLSNSLDVISTFNALKQLGAKIDNTNHNHIFIKFLKENTTTEINCDNSGTTARLLTGLVAANDKLNCILKGDESLEKRPMARIVDPLIQCGANIDYLKTTNKLPIQIFGKELDIINYSGQIASAQIKTSLMLAALQTPGSHHIELPSGSRTHTEIMLSKLGINIKKQLKEDVKNQKSYEVISLNGSQEIKPFNLTIPKDPSAAAFFCGLKLIKPNIPTIEIPELCFNSNRLSFLKYFEQLGLSFEFKTQESDFDYFEPIMTLILNDASSVLNPIYVPKSESASLIDELPILMTVSACANGESVFEGVDELRYKESNRLEATAELLACAGIKSKIESDKITISGNPKQIKAFNFNTRDDHRMAMSAAILSQYPKSSSVITNTNCVSVSYPGFWNDLVRICGEQFQQIHRSG